MSVLAEKRPRGRPPVHGNSSHPLFDCWRQMICRCTDPTNKRFADYGGRGITVCRRWLGADGFRRFCADMGEKPSPRHSLDRCDNDGSYGPANCRWATSQEQNRNKRNAHSDADYERAYEMWLAGVPREEIAEKLGWGGSFRTVIRAFEGATHFRERSAR